MKALIILLILTTLAEAKPRSEVLYVLNGRPITCATVKWAVSIFSKEYLENEARKHNVTKKQRAQAEACLKGK